MLEIVDESNMVHTGRVVYMDGKKYDVVTGGISKLDLLNEGLQEFYNDIIADDTTSQRLELSIITFNDHVKVLQEPALLENISMPTLKADGETAMADAINEAIDKVEARKSWYKETGQTYYRPYIILMTDGEPDAGQDMDALAERIKLDTASKKYIFLPVGVEGADMNVLQKISGEGQDAVKLKGVRFSQFFKWLSASMGIVTKAEGSQPNDLPTEIPSDIPWDDFIVI
jgi:uncharacterized protein YegL